MLIAFEPSSFTLFIHAKKLLKENEEWTGGFLPEYPAYLLPPDISSLTPKRHGLFGKDYRDDRFPPD